MKTNKPAKPQSVASITLQVIHAQRLWRYFGKEGADAANEAVINILGVNRGITVEYFQWIKSRYLAQKILGLGVDRLINLTMAQRAKLREIRVKMRESQ